MALLLVPLGTLALDAPNPALPESRHIGVPPDTPTVLAQAESVASATAAEIAAGEGEIPKVPEVSGASQAPTGAEDQPDIGEVITGVGKVIDDWENVGWLAGVIALINFLLGLLRFRPIDIYLAENELKWVKPLLAVVLGGALGGFSAFSTGASMLNSAVAGIMAGLGSVGFHQLMAQTTTKKG